MKTDGQFKMFSIASNKNDDIVIKCHREVCTNSIAAIFCVSVAVVLLFFKPELSLPCLIPILLTLPVLTSNIGDDVGKSSSTGGDALNAGTSSGSDSGGCDGC